MTNPSGLELEFAAIIKNASKDELARIEELLDGLTPGQEQKVLQLMFLSGTLGS